MTKEEIISEIAQSLGYASMCWNPYPTGEFDSAKAEEETIRLFEKVQEYVTSEVEELKKQAEYWKSKHDATANMLVEEVEALRKKSEN